MGEAFIPQVEFVRQRGYFGPIVPLALLEFSELTSSAKLIWAALASCAGGDGGCWPSYRKLSKLCGISIRGAQDAVKELREKGFIEWDRGGPGMSNVYALLWHDLFENARQKNNGAGQG